MEDDQLSMNALAEKWIAGTITEAEKQVLENWYHAQQNPTGDWTREQSEEDFRKAMFALILQKIDEQEKEQAAVKIRRMYIQRAVQVAAVLVVAVVSYWFLSDGEKQVQPPVIVQTIEALPGTEDAVLRLSSGAEINLSKAPDGRIVDDGETFVNKVAGSLSYNTAEQAADTVVETHEIITRRGNKYHLLLADGTEVWLNSASSLKFPERFIANQRVVELQGEAYFEVAHNAEKPFLVRANGTEVRVLGTHFDVCAYRDEPELKTTLLEGSVQVQAAGDQVIIKPGEQAVITDGEQHILVAEADLNKEMAWKDGFFEFDGVKLPVILRQLSRWYDVDFRLDGDLGNETYGGRISKELRLSKVIELLELNNIRFEIENDTLTVRAK